MPVSLLQGLQALKNNGAVAINHMGEVRNIHDKIEKVADQDALHGSDWMGIDWQLEDGRELYRLNDANRMMFDGTHVTGIFN
jgi:hypothetical protein